MTLNAANRFAAEVLPLAASITSPATQASPATEVGTTILAAENVAAEKVPAMKEPGKKVPAKKCSGELIQKARELRDRWMEQLNADAGGVGPIGKYDVVRRLRSDVSRPDVSRSGVTRSAEARAVVIEQSPTLSAGAETLPSAGERLAA